VGVWTSIQACGAKQELPSMTFSAALVAATTKKTIVVTLAADVPKFEIIIRATLQTCSFKVQIKRFERLRVAVPTLASFCGALFAGVVAVRMNYESGTNAIN
jgi:hypothetical protein